MSYTIRLEYDGNPVSVKRHSEGGTCVAGVIKEGKFIAGTDEAELNVTFNYGKLYREHLNPEGLKWIHGKKAQDVVESIEKAVRELGIEQSKDYWEPTEGNAGYALRILLEWARLHPDAMFRVY